MYIISQNKTLIASLFTYIFQIHSLLNAHYHSSEKPQNNCQYGRLGNMQEPLALKGISCYSSRESSTRNESFSCCDPYNCEVKCNLDIGNYGYLQSGKSDAVQVTPFCEVSISSHNGGLSEDRSMCQASIKGH